MCVCVCVRVCALPPVSILAPLVLNIGVPRAAADGVLSPGQRCMMALCPLRCAVASCDVVVAVYLL